MQIIKNEEYLHIQRKHGLGSYDWSVGDKFEVGSSNNDFFKFFEDVNKSINNDMAGISYNVTDVAGIMLLFLNNGVKLTEFDFYHYDSEKSIQELLGTLNHYVRLVRELMFEEVRSSHFPDHPSRQRGIWVIPNTLDSLEYWKKELGQGRLFKLKLSGKIHKANQEYLQINTNGLSYWREKAFHYWNEEPGLSVEQEECIFEGQVEVLEELEYFPDNPNTKGTEESESKSRTDQKTV
ncbi:DUF2441 domain-containing protein [Paenibacillus lautus]